MSDEGKEVSIEMKKTGKFLVDEKCFNQQKNCLSLKSVGKFSGVKRTPAELVGHPASQHCSDLGGEVLVLRDKDQNQWNFCKFGDGSMIESWSLFRSLPKAKGKK